ncbi:hypothetical protein [Salmonella sp. SAL4359]|uniref:hypothetical protein n=1 Tax=Salmonella sp. SAL4359 TaxID=3159880 RepID=UPI00397D5336
MKADQHPPRTEPDTIEQAMAALGTAGIIDEPSPATREWARQEAMTVDEMRAALAGGPSLVDLVDEQRGPQL